MQFNSFSFAIFLPIVYLLYWFGTKGNLKLQNILLLVSSYIFYACWDWKFLFLLIFSTLLDYFTGIKINQSKGHKKKLFWLWLSIVVNLGFLGVFKYYNFFALSFVNLLASTGLKVHLETLNIILPVGISFYTFHGLSYVIDIYKDKIKPERNFIDYSLFVSFFPLLVAGPIERATHLLPQIIKKREFNYLKAVDGLKQILWGLFKKIVIADNCAEYANVIFNNSQEYTGSTLLLGALFFTFQIYCDFSGYSDIALGTARLFGIELLRNFAFPYFSRDIAEFWRRWHISLSSWFKDYLYFPLGGSKLGKLITIRNTLIIFLVSGFWHGANWTFIVWGFLNALYIMPSIIFNTNRNNLDIVASGRYIPSLRELLSMGLTFCLTVFAWIFFRANDLNHAFSFISEIFSSSLLSIPYFRGIGNAVIIVPIIFLFMLIEWIGREGQYAISHVGITWKRPIRYLFYYLLLFMILYFGNFNESQFIYFQF
ncbi:MBOAT family O-acyltransferase [Aquirufa nivalisilvae]|uniref:MBOAT family O-acyltransferase n=1 Tax=Aquirufa nivalisilvae TaxID=2516557 RepID=UPI0022A93BD7|nr:MBOAT family O-acyltransferase [Aquirufa nivalisilvae]MCZ2479759.1 MBOAT family protein [Aquirufa nivalisilvae]